MIPVWRTYFYYNSSHSFDVDARGVLVKFVYIIKMTLTPIEHKLQVLAHNADYRKIK
jgi:hypothetical protein